MSEVVKINGYDVKDLKSVRSYDTVALMKADTKLKEGQHVKTKGYYEANDSGYGEYVIVDDETLVDDGGLIHVLTNGLRAVLLVNNSVNIKQLGYVDTMTASEQTTFLNDVFSKFNNILIKDVNITINDSLILHTGQNIVIDNSTILNNTSTNSKYIFDLVDIENVNINGINSVLKFNKPSTDAQSSIRIRESKNINITGLIIEDVGGDGILLLGTEENLSTNINIENCIIDNSRRNGIALVGGIKGCYINRCNIKNTVGTLPQYGIDLEPWETTIYNDDIVISNCYLENNSGGDIDILYNNRNIKILNNVLNNINTVMTLNNGESSYLKNCTIEGNKINSRIDLNGTQYSEINILNNNFTNAIIYCGPEIGVTPFYNTYPKNGYLNINNNNFNNSKITCDTTCNVVIEDNNFYDNTNNCVTVRSSNNIKINNNNFRNYAQTDTNKTSVFCIDISNTHNISITNNTFINEQEVTFTRIITLNANCQNLIATDNNALNITYSAFIGKDGTITHEIIENNLTNS